ncbi:MAG TPA: sigma-70 family RNA polymerase sigma factor [Mucilaginibacter sp.]|nr:sigma-70 family RNA polymerase sigma factor [Mucilaginibacter sp.]
MDHLTDEEIVNLVLKGQVDLFESLMRKYNERLYRISLSIVEDDKEAEDVMQIAYINAYRQLNNFRHQCSFGTWLTRILINESLLHKKRIQRTEQLRMETNFTDVHPETPLSGLINKELGSILEGAVASLPEKYRLVFVMREVQGMSTNETMEALNIGESNVKIRLNRAKEILRADLQRVWNPREIYEFNLRRCDIVVDNVMKVIRQLS